MSGHEIHEDTLVAVVAAIRAADARFLGGEGQYVKDCLLPEFAARDITLVLRLDNGAEAALKP
jgi:hypothetical protein